MTRSTLCAIMAKKKTVCVTTTKSLAKFTIHFARFKNHINIGKQFEGCTLRGDVEALRAEIYVASMDAFYALCDAKKVYVQFGDEKIRMAEFCKSHFMNQYVTEKL